MELSYFAIIIGAIFVNNVVLAQFLGICPFLGVSSKVETSLGMGAAVTFVMAIAAVVAWLIQTYVLVPLDIVYMQTIVFILVIAALVQMVEIMLKKLSPSLYQALGIFLPLITTNCAVLGVAILMIQKEFNLLQSIVYSVATAIGFALALMLFACIRERLELEDVPKAVQGVPVALITAGILAMAFMGFSGLVLAGIENYRIVGVVMGDPDIFLLLHVAFRCVETSYGKMEESEFNIRVLCLRDKMFRFARSILHRRDEAEDVPHDTIEKLWRRRVFLDGCRDVEAFGLTSLRNGCFDRLRRVRPLAGDTFPFLAAEAEDERAEAREIVAKAMARLSPKLREVLHLKDIEGYATHEIARMLGVEENQVRTILSRARRGLRETIEKMDYGTNDGRY